MLISGSRLFSQSLVKERILNVGCGPDEYGTDFVDIYPTRPNVVVCDASSQPLPYPNGVFDEVYSKNFLEHVANLEFTVKEMARVAKPGGSVRVITDNAGWILFHVPLRRGNYAEHYSNGPRFGAGDRHYCLFTPLHLQNLFQAAGLEVKRVDYQYYSKRRSVHRLGGLFRFLSRTPIRHLVYPHIEIIGTRP
jgi:SAM-dependent methyltransferase